MLEADIHRQGLDLPEAATIRRASIMLPYLQHYAAELAAYAQLAYASDEWGFFASDRGVLDLGGHATQRMSLPPLGLRFHTYRVYSGDPNCVWESVERRLSTMEGMLRELHEEAETRGTVRGVPPPGPIDLGARLSDPCSKHGTHPIGTCSGRKRRG